MSTIFPNFMAQHGADLAGNGFHILPIHPGQKFPGVFAQGDWRVTGGWQQHCDRPNYDAEIDTWAGWPECAIGIACGYTVGIDIDVPDGAIALQIDALAREMLGDTPLVRIGLPPKRLLVYRAEVPFPTRNRHPIQLLARGAQFVARGIHPHTGQPYTWPEDQPEECAISRLPLVEQAQCMAFLDAAYELVPVELRPKTVIGSAPAGTAPADPRGTRAAIESAMRFLPNNDMDRDSWVKIGLAIKGALGEDGRDLWLDWSHASSKSGKSGKSDTAERKWRGFNASSIGAGTIYYLAGQTGWKPAPDMILNAAAAEAVAASGHVAQGIIDQMRQWRDRGDGQRHHQTEREQQAIPAPRVSKLTLDKLRGVAVPEREWIVQDWIPVGCVTMVNAEGGVGKTLLMILLTIAAATGNSWMGLQTTQCRSVGLFSEDDMAELHRRAAAISDGYGVDMGDLWGVTVMSGAGLENTLAEVRDGKISTTARWDELRDEVLATDARLVIIDTAATSFSGNENDRAQVTNYVGGVLTSLAQEINGAVVLLAHPSKSAKANKKQGEVDNSGSTGWNGSVRSRIGLEIPLDEDGNPIRDRRVMTLVKANYGRSGMTVTIQMTDNGVPMPAPSIGAAGAPEAAADIGDMSEQEKETFAEDFAATFLAELRAAGVHVSRSSAYGLAKEMRDRKRRCPLDRRHINAAVDRLITKGKFTIYQTGRSGHWVDRIDIVH